jgi:pimeloyl-ACP methyl ester carboxylesterase
MSILMCVLSVGFAYVNSVAKGGLEKWDPQDYLRVDANGMSFSVNVRGDKLNTPVILLHGFPESAVMWDKFMDELATQNYYAIAPNQRGYSSGARPEDVKSYELDFLVSDVMQIADKLGIDKFHLVGHDWGAGVGWKLAADHPERVLSYVAISVPHIDSFGVAYREDPDQYEASDYVHSSIINEVS